MRVTSRAKRLESDQRAARRTSAARSNVAEKISCYVLPTTLHSSKCICYAADVSSTSRRTISSAQAAPQDRQVVSAACTDCRQRWHLHTCTCNRWPLSHPHYTHLCTLHELSSGYIHSVLSCRSHICSEPHTHWRRTACIAKERQFADCRTQHSLYHLYHQPIIRSPSSVGINRNGDVGKLVQPLR